MLDYWKTQEWQPWTNDELKVNPCVPSANVNEVMRCDCCAFPHRKPRSDPARFFVCVGTQNTNPKVSTPYRFSWSMAKVERGRNESEQQAYTLRIKNGTVPPSMIHCPEHQHSLHHLSDQYTHLQIRIVLTLSWVMAYRHIRH
jgi:hypothetical protein